MDKKVKQKLWFANNGFRIISPGLGVVCKYTNKIMTIQDTDIDSAGFILVMFYDSNFVKHDKIQKRLDELEPITPGMILKVRGECFSENCTVLHEQNFNKRDGWMVEVVDKEMNQFELMIDAFLEVVRESEEDHKGMIQNYNGEWVFGIL